MNSFLKNKKSKLLLIFALALVIRLAGISTRPIWYDEAFSILLAEQGPAAILSGTLATDADSSAAEEHPPAYYFTLWGWIQIFGNSPTSIRLLSIALSLGIIFYIYLIAIHLFDEQTALTAAFLAAILPFQIHYGVEIRMYVLLTFWLCLATYALLKRQWILFSIAAALAQYTHNLAAFYLIPLAFMPIFQQDWKTLRSLIGAGFVSIILYLPWLMQIPAQLEKVTSSFWIEKPGIEKLFTLFLVYLPHLPLSNNQLLPGLLLATLTISLAAFQTYRAQKEKSPQAKNGLWMVYLSFTPPLLLWLASQISPMYVERALLPSHAIFCIWLAWAFTQTKLLRPVQLLTFLLILSSAGMGFYQHFTYTGFPYVASTLNQKIQSRLEKGDIVIHSSKLSYLPSFYYDRTLSQGFIADPPNSSVDTLSPATQRIFNTRSFENIESGTANAPRVWLIIYQQSVNEFIQANKTHPHLEYLNQHFELNFTEEWGDINIYVFSRLGN
jgi:4-amino-4-deoxy-L-arabinose transferase-like glycosyltransferase